MFPSKTIFVAGFALVVGIGAAAPVHAFTIFDHKAITVEALRDYKYRMTSGTEIMFADLEPIYDANLRQDWKRDEPGEPPAQRQQERHCDNADLAGCKLRVDVKRAEIVTSLLDPPDGALARAELGKALHTIQDFYAHSTWVETRSGIADPSLNSGPTDEEPCTGTGDTPSGNKLTSGWYFHGFTALENATRKIGAPDFGCLHGQLVSDPSDPLGPFVTLPGIAKDSSRSAHYDEARMLAVQATVKFVNEISMALPPANRDSGMCALMGAANCQGRVLAAVVTIWDRAPDTSWFGALPGTAENSSLGSPVTPPSSWFGNSGSTCVGAEGGFHFQVDADAVLYPAPISNNFPAQFFSGYSARRPCSSFVAVKNLGTPLQEVWLVGATRFQNPASGSTREWQVRYYSGDPADPVARPRLMEIGLSASGFYSKLMDVSSYQVELVREVLP